MIKKYLLGLLLGFVGFVSFGYAGKVGYIGVSEDSTLNDSYSIKVNGNGLLYTNYLGLGKAMLQFGDGVYFFWSNNNYPYMYVTSDSGNPNTHNVQGYVKTYLICDYIGMNTGDNIQISNCTKYNINDGNFENVGQRYLQSLSNSGYFYYDIFQFNNNPRNAYCGTLTVCFSSSEFNKSMCFVGSNGAMTRPCNEYNANVYSLYSTETNLSGSLNLGPYFDNISTSILGNGFGFTPGSNDNTNNNIAINTTCPTVGQLISSYNNGGFNSGMCYTSNRIYSGGSFVSVDPVSIFDLYSSSDEYVDDVYKYGQYCESSVYGQNVCSEAFSGEFLKFNLISKLPNNLSIVGGRKQLYTYCNLYNLPENATTCVLSGALADYGVEYTNSDFVHSIANGEFDFVTPNTSGTVFDGDYTFSGDIISNIKGIYAKFTSLFKKQTSNTNGILPTFIIIPFILIVLFKLFKK